MGSWDVEIYHQIRCLTGLTSLRLGSFGFTDGVEIAEVGVVLA